MQYSSKIARIIAKFLAGAVTFKRSKIIHLLLCQLDKNKINESCILRILKYQNICIDSVCMGITALQLNVYLAGSLM